MTTTKGLTGRALGEAVIDVVLTRPEEHWQETTASDWDAGGEVLHDEAATPCGSTYCIAGWAIALHYGVCGRREIWALSYEAPEYRRSCDVAAELLGVDSQAFEAAVFSVKDNAQAIANFKHLLDETYSERIV